MAGGGNPPSIAYTEETAPTLEELSAAIISGISALITKIMEQTLAKELGKIMNIGYVSREIDNPKTDGEKQKFVDINNDETKMAMKASAQIKDLKISDLENKSET